MLKSRIIASSVLPPRCMRCMALAKGFADRSALIDDTTSGKRKQKLPTKKNRREDISHELQQLQAAHVHVPTRESSAPSQRSNGSRPSSADSSQQQHSPGEVASLAKDLQEEVLSLQRDVRSSKFFRDFQDVFWRIEEPAAGAHSQGETSTSGHSVGQDRWQWSSVKQMVLYGLGSPRLSVASRYQLAFALLLTELLPGLTAPLDTFDPAFDDVDRALLSNLGVTVHAADEQCARVAQEPTLFYMPHCITTGFGNLLRVNAGCLDRVAILGNTFLGYRVSWKIGRTERGEIQEILQLMEEGRVKESAISENDMEGVSDRAYYRQSLHLFKSIL